MYCLRCENGGRPWWIIKMEGDPGRTTVEDSAQLWKTKSAARKALVKIVLQNPHRALDGRLLVTEVK